MSAVRAGYLTITLLILLGQGRLVAHEDILTRIAELDLQIADGADDPVLLLRRADLHRRHKEWDEALRDYDAAAVLTPDNTAVQIGRARVHLDRGRAKDALRPLAVVLKTHPDHAGALLLRARALTAVGDHEAATPAFDVAIAAAARPLPEYYMEAVQNLVNATPPRFLEAIAVLDRGIERLGDIVSLQYTAMELEQEAGLLQAALARTRHVRSGPAGRSPSWTVREAEILKKLGEEAAAQTMYANALAQVEALAPRRRAAPAIAALERKIRAAMSKDESSAPRH